MSATITGSTQQIISSYEDNGLSPEEISEAFGGEFDLLAIKAILMQFSGKYREESKEKKDGVGFTESDEEAAIRTINTLREYADDESLRGKMAIYIREDRQGRRDAVSKLAQNGMGGNIIQFQVFLNKANAALKVTEQKALDIKSEVTKVA